MGLVVLLGSFAATLLLGVPVAFAMGISAALTFWGGIRSVARFRVRFAFLSV